MVLFLLAKKKWPALTWPYTKIIFLHKKMARSNWAQFVGSIELSCNIGADFRPRVNGIFPSLAFKTLLNHITYFHLDMSVLLFKFKIWIWLYPSYGRSFQGKSLIKIFYFGSFPTPLNFRIVYRNIRFQMKKTVISISSIQIKIR